MLKYIRAARLFLQETIWQETRSAKQAVGFLTRLLRISVIVAKSFYDDKIFLRASALAFTTLLSLVPLLAFTFSILKGLGAVELLSAPPSAETAVEALADPAAPVASAEDAALPPASEGSVDINPEILNYLTGGRTEVSEQLGHYISNAITYVARTNVGALGAFGLVFLIWTVIKVLSTIEASFNDIWGVARGRTWLRQFSDYISIVVIAPILLVVAIGLSAYVKSVLSGSGIHATIGEFVLGFLARLGPWFLIWAAFTTLYSFMPNTSVKLSAALAGGFIAALLWQLGLWGYTTFQVGVSRYNAIYGSFAALPIFLVWLHLSWVITLFGAEVTYAYEHVETLSRRLAHFKPSPASRERIALRLFLETARAFYAAAAPLDSDSLAETAGLPVAAVDDCLAPLAAAGILSRVESENVRGWQPGRDLSLLTPGDVIAAVRSAGSPLDVPDSDPLWSHALSLADGFDASLTESDLATPIAEILKRSA